MESSELLAHVKREVESNLSLCDSEQLDVFSKYSVQPYFASISRYGRVEQVVVVARKKDEVIYWEDVEEGFNVSSLGHDGSILDHWCNQDELGLALNSWIDGRERPVRLGPADRTD